MRPAGLAVRFFAFVIDWIVRLMVLYAAAIVTSLMGGVGTAFWLILLFGLEWLYPVIFELTPSGSTPGKKVMGLKVVMDNGLPVTPASSFARNLLRTADFLPFGFGFGIFSMLLRNDCKRLGDLAAGSIVVYVPGDAARVAPAVVPPLAPARPIPAVDQAAVVALAVRAPTLTRARLDELAALAASVSGDEGRSGPEVTRRVLGVAQWVLGRR